MQKSLTHREVLAARRKNTMMLVLLFVMISLLMGFAFGKAILYVIAVFALPVVVLRIWEEVSSHYQSRNPVKAEKIS